MHLPRRALVGLFPSLALSALSSLARATTLRFRSLDELVAMADLVIVGLPRSSASRWVGGHIVTDHQVEVLTVARGALPTGVFTVTVRTPGGVVAELGQSLAGAPTLERDRAALMLLTVERGGVREVQNLSAGIFSIETSAHGAPRVMPARTEEIHFVGAPSAVTALLSLPPGGAPLSEFLLRLRAFRP